MRLDTVDRHMKPETVTYARRDGRELLIDVYRPESAPKAAVITAARRRLARRIEGGDCAGGAGSGRSRLPRGAGAVPPARRRRVAGCNPGREARRSAGSGATAARLASGAGKIAIEGFSAGAHLALLVAGTSHVAAYSAADDADEDDSVGRRRRFLLADRAADRCGAARRTRSEASRLLQDATSAGGSSPGEPDQSHHRPVSADMPAARDRRSHRCSRSRASACSTACARPV